MQVCYCDICKTLIKLSDDRFAMMVTKIEEENNVETPECLHTYNRKYQEVDTKEICGKCKKIYDYLFNLRTKEVEMIRKTIEKMYNLKTRKKGKNA